MTPPSFHQAEHRREPRKWMASTTKVVDAMTQQIIGRLGNLSPSGMMVIGPHSPRENAIYQFQLELVTRSASTHLIEVGVRALWQKKAARPGQVWAGYETIAISDADFQLLRTWLVEPS